MSVFTRFSLRSLARNRTRTAVSIMGIALSCALICAVLTTVASMTRMLAERTVADEGAWQLEAAGVTEKGHGRLAADSRVADRVDVVELGAVALGDENAVDYGSYLFVKTWPQNPAGTEVSPLPEIISGRAPAAPGEVLLPNYFEGVELAPSDFDAEGTIEIGDSVSFKLGERTITEGDGTTYVATSSRSTVISEDDGMSQTIARPLGELDDLEVVGFYRAWGASSTISQQGNSAYIYPPEGIVDAALSDDSDATCVYSLMTLRDPADASAMAEEFAGDDLVTGGTVTHNSLLRWQGITQDSVVWNVLYQIAGVLAAIIAIAGVSLVYNAFAISVSERTRQFGLLASLGASKRQLRRTVLTEALVLSAVSIPIGIALGLAGCAVVFSLTGSGLTALVGIDDAANVGVSVEPAALLLSAAIALATVLVSAWVPALRASRVSAVDAIRQTQDVRIRRSTLRRVRRTAVHGTDRARRSLAERVLGVPGFVARRNLTRSTSKGRVTVAALAVSVALLIASGSFADVLGYASGVVVDDKGPVDLSVTVDATSAASEDGTAVRTDGHTDPTAFQEALKSLYDDARASVDGEALGYYTRFIADAIVPSGLLSDEATSFFGLTLSDGSWSGPVYIDLVDNATWASYIDRLGLDPDAFTDPDRPRAVLLNEYDYASGDAGTYSSYSPLARTGDIETVTFAPREGMYVGGIISNDAGEPVVWYNAPDGSEALVPLEEGLSSRTTLTVGALADTAPLSISNHTNTLHLILPVSALAATENIAYGDARIDFSCDGSAEAASRLQEDFEAVAEDHPELDCVYSNYAQEAAQARLMSQTVQTFIYCFTIVTGLIAVANVFNTLTTSLILRRREFAVLRSIGMGPRAFRRMIAYECASYALRGFALGFALAVAIHAILFETMSDAFTSFTFTLPWPQVGLSAAIALAVILVSVAYALRASRTGSVVEALRSDAI